MALHSFWIISWWWKCVTDADLTKLNSQSVTPTPSNVARLVCGVLVNSDTLTTNYSVKQSQFTKLTSEPNARNPEESNEAFDHVIRE